MAFIVSSTLGALVVISLFVAVMIPFMMGTVRRCNGFVGCGLGPSWFRESHWNGDSKRDAARATDYCIVLDDIAVAIIRMIFWRAVTVVVTLRLPQSGASKNIAPTMSATI